MKKKFNGLKHSIHKRKTTLFEDDVIKRLLIYRRPTPMGVLRVWKKEQKGCDLFIRVEKIGKTRFFHYTNSIYTGHEICVKIEKQVAGRTRALKKSRIFVPSLLLSSALNRLCLISFTKSLNVIFYSANSDFFVIVYLPLFFVPLRTECIFRDCCCCGWHWCCHGLWSVVTASTLKGCWNNFARSWQTSEKNVKNDVNCAHERRRGSND